MQIPEVLESKTLLYYLHLPEEAASLSGQIHLRWPGWYVQTKGAGGGGLFPDRVLQGRKHDALKSSLTQGIKEKLLSPAWKEWTFLSNALLLPRRLAGRGRLPVCVNGVLLGHSHAHSFPDPPWLPSCDNSSAAGLRQRRYVAREAWNTDRLALHREGLPTPAPEPSAHCSSFTGPGAHLRLLARTLCFPCCCP